MRYTAYVKMCQDCGIVCSTTEQLLRHYKFEHKNETKGQQELVLPPIPEKVWIQFNLEEKTIFRKLNDISLYVTQTLNARTFRCKIQEPRKLRFW
jgi:Fe-S-cluster containining protein